MTYIEFIPELLQFIAIFAYHRHNGSLRKDALHQSLTQTGTSARNHDMLVRKHHWFAKSTHMHAQVNDKRSQYKSSREASQSDLEKYPHCHSFVDQFPG